MPTPSATRRIRFFTIAAANYLANAIVLSQSIASVHAGSRLSVYLLDDLPTDCPGLEHINVIPVAATMSVADWHHYQCFYTLLELATGVKPLCFEHLLDGDCDVAIYLDADIVVFAPFHQLLAAIGRGHEIVLTPHILTPLPADGKMPDDLVIMRAGIYNLGFAAFTNGPQSKRLLAWWARQLRTLGLADVNAGLFTDQKWMDFAPALAATTCILRDPGYNVAYWNLHERTLKRRDKRWCVDWVDGSQHILVFFHFSGFSTTSPALSKHDTRYGSSPPADTRQLLDHYTRLLAAAGHARYSQRIVAEPRFASGQAWDAICRILYRTLLKADAHYGDPLQGDGFLAWAAQVAEGEHVSRYMRALLSLRPDLSRAYDDGRDRMGLLGWLAEHGQAQLGFNPQLLQLDNLDGHDRQGVH